MWDKAIFVALIFNDMIETLRTKHNAPKNNDSVNMYKHALIINSNLYIDITNVLCLRNFRSLMLFFTINQFERKEEKKMKEKAKNLEQIVLSLGMLCSII